MVESNTFPANSTTSPTGARPPIVELISVQYLRAAAALGVVVWHAQGQMGIKETTILQAGIEIFFIISGYVMWLILGARPVSPATFLRKRILRVVPLYWVLTTFMVVLLIVAPGLLQSARFDLHHVIASYLFVAWPNPVEAAGLKPVMIPGWTLNYEMFFYGLLAVCLPLKGALRTAVIIGVLSALAALSLLPLPPIAHFYASPFMLEFAMGILLAIGMSKAPRRLLDLGPWVFVIGLILAILGGEIIAPDNHGRLILFAIPATLVIGGLVAWEQYGALPRIPLLKAVGDASYPLYMIHPVLLSAMAQGWRLLGLTALSPWLFVAAGVVVTSLVGWLAHITLERPLMRVFRPRSKPRSSIQAPALAIPSATEV